MKQFIEVTDLNNNRVFINIVNITHIVDKDTHSCIYVLSGSLCIKLKVNELYNDIRIKIKDLENM